MVQALRGLNSPSNALAHEALPVSCLSARLCASFAFRRLRPASPPKCSTSPRTCPSPLGHLPQANIFLSRAEAAAPCRCAVRANAPRRCAHTLNAQAWGHACRARRKGQPSLPAVTTQGELFKRAPRAPSKHSDRVDYDDPPTMRVRRAAPLNWILACAAAPRALLNAPTAGSPHTNSCGSSPPPANKACKGPIPTFCPSPFSQPSTRNPIQIATHTQQQACTFLQGSPD